MMRLLSLPLLSSLSLALVSLIAHAQDAETVPVPGTASAWPMIIVSLLIIGMVGGFLWYIWYKEQQSRRRTAAFAVRKRR